MEPEKEQGYRPINIEFLGYSEVDNFDIYYKSNTFGTITFVKFASSNPEHQDKVKRLMETEDFLEEFFIQEGDLFKYYKHATQSLRKIVSSTFISFEKKTEKVYEISKNIMKEFFEYNASEKVLQSSEEVIEIMEDCLRSSKAEFYAISQITHKDYYTYTHSVNVGLYCMTFGVKHNLPSAEVRELGLGGMLHDVGKSKIAHEILNKKGRLTEQEFEEIKKHPGYGEEILLKMNCYGRNVVDMAIQHHEKYNGDGYPNNLEGEEIAYFARICKVMDVYDALTTSRSYKKTKSPYETLRLMKKNMVEEFDLDILNKFINYMGPG